MPILLISRSALTSTVATNDNHSCLLHVGTADNRCVHFQESPVVERHGLYLSARAPSALSWNVNNWHPARKQAANHGALHIEHTSRNRSEIRGVTLCRVGMLAAVIGRSGSWIPP